MCGSDVLVVGLAGFEPTTSCPPDKRANQAALQPEWIPTLSPQSLTQLDKYLNDSPTEVQTQKTH